MAVHGRFQSQPEESCLNNTLQELRRFYTTVSPSPESWEFLLQWPIHLPPDFVSLLEQGNPAALAMLAHWCVAVHNAPRKWYMGEFAHKVMDKIYRQLESTAWGGVVEWPVSQILQPGVA